MRAKKKRQIGSKQIKSSSTLFIEGQKKDRLEIHKLRVQVHCLLRAKRKRQIGNKQIKSSSTLFIETRKQDRLEINKLRVQVHCL